jgi:L-galactose dehydrogenase
VVYAVKHGINLIDTAPWYGHGKAETVLGEALKGIPREAYILNTKVGRYLPDPMDMFDFTAERVTKSVDESLARLGVDYIDIIQVHDPEFAPFVDIIVEETLPALVKLQEAGKVKMIGMTGKRTGLDACVAACVCVCVCAGVCTRVRARQCGYLCGDSRL